MFRIENPTETERQFHNVAKRIVTIPPLGGINISVAQMPLGVLRIFDRDPNYEVEAKSPEAEAKLKEARAPRSKRRGMMVHGGSEAERDAQFARERSPLVEVRDHFTPPEPRRRKPEPQKAGLDAAPPSDEQPPAPPPADQPKSERHAALFTLIADENNPDVDLSLKELRRRAKELLGEDYPPGNLGREDIIAAVKQAASKAE